jgi:hypothetical protein
MSDIQINVDTCNMDSDTLNILKKKFPKLNILKDNNMIHFSFKIEDNSQYLSDSLFNLFYNLDSDKYIHKLNSFWSFNENETYLFNNSIKIKLTYKESLFLKFLLINNNFMTYEYMRYLLWQDKDHVTNNAIKQFIKNLKRKLPLNIKLENIYFVGYRLIS